MTDPITDKLTSIIIVTYNRLDQTIQCVDSIAAHTPEAHEFVFIDNASSDGTSAYLKERFGDERVIANDSNLGFLRAANQGIARARGDYLLLMNNDTTVTPGWLTALQQALERSGDTGIASGKIVGPDGRIQLAGAYIAFDGSARMIGEGLSPDDPSLGNEREVCYVGGHCMLIKQEVIEAAGPLDEAYGFGYHEDTDYCYAARRAGYRVIYTPGCLIHHQLFGTPMADRLKIIADNQRLFMDRWGSQLFLNRFIGARIEFRADRLELPVGAGWYAAEEEYTCTGQEAWCWVKAGDEMGLRPHPVTLANRRVTPLPEGEGIGNSPRSTERWGESTDTSPSGRGEGEGVRTVWHSHRSTQHSALSTQHVLELVAMASHPDLGERPVHAEVLVNGELVGHAFFNTPWEWKQLFFPVPASCESQQLRVDLRVDRTWTPDELFQDGRDPRQIGLAVRRISIGTAAEAAEWAAEGVPLDSTLQRLKEHADFLQKAIVEKDAFYARELDGKERLISQLQSNLERYHATPPFRIYFALKHLLGGKSAE